ncbi:MAG: nucleotidyltransferase domain-containing protein [Euryarchaeota archaeon]|nr:nucleotidyltransferase domain-containing protein [Euryarchaeota archaeon]
MLFRRYLEMLLGSKVKVKVLRTLWKHKEKEFTIRELGSFLKISHMGIRKVLADLERANAVKIMAVGRSHTIKLNKEGYAAAIVEKIFKLEEETLGELLKMLKKRLCILEVKSAALFGSVARGEESPLSDIDVFILTNEREKTERAVLQLQREVALKFGNALAPYYLSEDEFVKKKDTPAVRQILRSHVLICGKPLDSDRKLARNAIFLAEE